VLEARKDVRKVVELQNIVNQVEGKVRQELLAVVLLQHQSIEKLVFVHFVGSQIRHHEDQALRVILKELQVVNVDLNGLYAPVLLVIELLPQLCWQKRDQPVHLSGLVLHSQDPLFYLLRTKELRLCAEGNDLVLWIPH
jgi:hypothetical protein